MVYIYISSFFRYCMFFNWSGLFRPGIWNHLFHQLLGVDINDHFSGRPTNLGKFNITCLQRKPMRNNLDAQSDSGTVSSALWIATAQSSFFGSSSSKYLVSQIDYGLQVMVSLEILVQLVFLDLSIWMIYPYPNMWTWNRTKMAL